jgi:hypothetical protein
VNGTTSAVEALRRRLAAPPSAANRAEEIRELEARLAELHDAQDAQAAGREWFDRTTGRTTENDQPTKASGSEWFDQVTGRRHPEGKA